MPSRFEVDFFRRELGVLAMGVKSCCSGFVSLSCVQLECRFLLEKLLFEETS